MESALTVFGRAVAATQARQYEAALRDFLWLHNNPKSNSIRHQALRRTYWLFGWANLGALYPPARDQMDATLAATRLVAQTHGLDNGADIRAFEQMLAVIDAYDSRCPPGGDDGRSA